MSAIVDLRHGVANTLTTLTVEGGRLEGAHVSEHGGEFDHPKELKAYVKQCPAVVIAVLHVEGMQQGGQPLARVSMGAFVLTVARKTRDEQALAIVESLLDYILRYPSKNWGVEAGNPQGVEAQNCYTREFDDQNAACWGVFWTQDVALVTSPTPVLNDFTEMHVDYEVQDD